MFRKLLIRVLSSIVLLLLATSAHAVTFGQPDGDDHPYVGTLLFVQNGVGFFSCTGTLISPTVMLTAGHCVEGDGQVNDLTYVRFDEDALSGISDYASLQEWFDNEWIAAASVVPHPDYDDYSQFPETYDIGVVILPQPVVLSEYGSLPTPYSLDGILAVPGNRANRFEAVGYGSQGVIQPFAMDDYARYQADTRLIELNSYFNGNESSAKFTNNPGAVRGGTCFGDSGGPIFYQGTNVIMAIVSFGYTPCIGVDYQFRIDTPLALEFLSAYLD